MNWIPRVNGRKRITRGQRRDRSEKRNRERASFRRWDAYDTPNRMREAQAYREETRLAKSANREETRSFCVEVLRIAAGKRVQTTLFIAA